MQRDEPHIPSTQWISHARHTQQTAFHVCLQEHTDLLQTTKQDICSHNCSLLIRN